MTKEVTPLMRNKFFVDSSRLLFFYQSEKIFYRRIHNPLNS